MSLDLKTLRSALEQLEEERRIPKEIIIDAIEQALAAAYKKEYGKRGQIIRTHFDLETGETSFEQVKIVVDDSVVWFPEEETEDTDVDAPTAVGVRLRSDRTDTDEEKEEKMKFNPEHHILLEDAQKIKSDAKLEEEIIFPLEDKDDFGRIAAQTAKQVIIQRIREAEKSSVLDEYGDKEGQIISGVVQKVEQGNVFVDFDRATGVLPRSEQIPGERYNTGHRIKSYLLKVEETPRGISLKLSRTHPRFMAELFALEVPEIAADTVEIKSIAREPGNRSKIAVVSYDENIDPLGACVGQKGIRVSTVMSELGGEKIDIIPWSEEPGTFVANSLSPAQVLDIEIDEENKKAIIEVAPDQLSLAIGKGGQNVRLAAKLTGWKIDIRGTEVESGPADEEEELEDAPTAVGVRPQSDRTDTEDEKETRESAPEETKKEDVEEKKEEKIEAKATEGSSPDDSEESSREVEVEKEKVEKEEKEDPNPTTEDGEEKKGKPKVKAKKKTPRPSDVADSGLGTKTKKVKSVEDSSLDASEEASKEKKSKAKTKKKETKDIEKKTKTKAKTKKTKKEDK